jgi:predicted RNA-binding Zn-ribbon protein involved in translation (DUF1610 family)
MKDLSRTVSLLCPVCGNDQFDALDDSFVDFDAAPDDTQFKCADCGSLFTKEQLLGENSEKINIAIEEVKQEAIKEMKKELERAFRKWK